MFLESLLKIVVSLKGEKTLSSEAYLYFPIRQMHGKGGGNERKKKKREKLTGPTDWRR